MIQISPQLNTVTRLSKIVALALFVALPFIGFLVGKRYQESLCTLQTYIAEKPNNIIPLQNTNSSSDWQITGILEDLDWEIRSISDESNSLYGIPWDSRYSLEKYETTGVIHPSGTLYKITAKDGESLYEELGFYADQIERKLKNSGWVDSVTYEDNHLFAPYEEGGDVGMLSNMSGFIKINGDKLRSVIIHVEITFTSFIGPVGDFVCPCSRTLEIFVGDTINLNDYFRDTSEE